MTREHHPHGFDTTAWTPDQGYMHEGLFRAYRHDKDFAAKVNDAYIKAFNSRAGIEQYKFYDANKNIGNELWNELGINNEWIMAGDATVNGGQPFTGVLTPH